MEYWVSIKNNQIGPMSLDEVIALNPTSDTLVWHPGMPDWDKAVNIPELAHLFTPSIDKPQCEAPSSPVNDDFDSSSNQENASNEEPKEAAKPQPQAKTVVPTEPCPPTYLLWSVLVTILCCVVAGIPAIIYSSQVKSKYEAGDYDGAKKASNRAAWWLIIAFVIGLIYQPFSMVFSLL